MKRLIAVLVALMAISLTAVAFVPVLPEDWEETTIGTSVVYGSYGTGIINVQDGTGATQTSLDITGATSNYGYNALGMNAKIVNQLSTNVEWDGTSGPTGVVRQFIGQSGSAYSMNVPYGYDSQNFDPGDLAVGGFETSQFAVFSGNLDCHKSYTVEFDDESNNPSNYAEIGSTGHYINQEIDRHDGPDNAVKIYSADGNTLYEAFATEAISAQGRKTVECPIGSSTWRMSGYAELAGGFDDAWVTTGIPVTIDLSNGDADYNFWIN